MITLAFIGLATVFFKLPLSILSMSQDTQVILIAICVSSDLNILSQILRK